MEGQIFIPTEIKVGFRGRSDTYSKKLGFIIFKEDGQWVKEKTWEKWRDKSIAAAEFENKPVSGLVINKNVGGVTRYSHYDRMEKVRVYDPRGFEIEITVSNLLYILQETSCTKGKGLEGDFVYGWKGTNSLILIPIGSDLHKSAMNFTDIQTAEPLQFSDLVPGCKYLSKTEKIHLYLGEFHFHKMKQGALINPRKKSHVFCSRRYDWRDELQFFALEDISLLSRVQSEIVDSEYSERVNEFLTSLRGATVSGLCAEEELAPNQKKRPEYCVGVYKDYFIIYRWSTYSLSEEYAARSVYYMSGGKLCVTDKYSIDLSILWDIKFFRRLYFINDKGEKCALKLEDIESDYSYFKQTARI